MDTQTLAVANLMLFALYAGVMLLNTRVLGGSRAAGWFGFANLFQCFAMAALAIGGRMPRQIPVEISGVLMVAGMMMLHRSFAELLDRGLLLWRLHGVLLIGVAGGTLYLAHVHSAYPAALLLASATLGVQTALTASALFSFSGDGVEAAGWFAGVAFSAYALIHLLRVAVTLRYGSWLYPVRAAETEKLWLAGCLLANGATAFGFMFISTAKLRLQLLWRAQIDELTGLLNRWAFKRIAVKETFRCMRMRGRLAAVMMDLDGMKAVNDRMGHSCGDAVLQSVAATLQDGVRDRDSIARMGGDEFCILLPDTDLAEALTVAERLRAQIEAMSVRFRGETVRVRASFGVSSSDHCGWDWQTLVDQADGALYKAKRDGNKRVIAAEQSDALAAADAPTMQLETINERRRR